MSFRAGRCVWSPPSHVSVSLSLLLLFSPCLSLSISLFTGCFSLFLSVSLVTGCFSTIPTQKSLSLSLCYVSSIKYWFRLLKMGNERLPKTVYEMLLCLDRNGKDCWVSRIREILCETGFQLCMAAARGW